MTANNNSGAGAQDSPRLNTVTGGKRCTLVLSPEDGLVEVYLDDEAIGERPAVDLVRAYGRMSVICQRLVRGETVPVYSPHLAAWALGKASEPRPAAVEEVVKLNAFLNRRL